MKKKITASIVSPTQSNTIQMTKTPQEKRKATIAANKMFENMERQMQMDMLKNRLNSIGVSEETYDMHYDKEYGAIAISYFQMAKSKGLVNTMDPQYSVHWLCDCDSTLVFDDTVSGEGKCVLDVDKFINPSTIYKRLKKIVNFV